jgi:subtilisin family serine protease
VAFAVMIVFTNDSDEYSGEQWYLHDHATSKSNQKGGIYNVETIAGIKDVRAGTKSEKGADTVVAVIDTMMPNDDIDNDKNGYIDDCFGYNFLNEKGVTTLKPTKPGAHGTAIAGVICAKLHNKKGIEGITGNAHVTIMNLVVLDSYTTEGNLESLIAAIEYAETNGASICNISSNYEKASDELLKTIQQSQMLFVVSAGNRPTLGVSIDEVVNIPAMYNFQNVITVSAFTQEQRILRQANYGPNTVDIVAPGDEILAPIPGNQYAYFSGSSISTPMVTGIAALLDQNTTKITAPELKAQILSIVSHNDDYEFKIKDGAYLQLHDILFR